MYRCWEDDLSSRYSTRHFAFWYENCEVFVNMCHFSCGRLRHGVHITETSGKTSKDPSKNPFKVRPVVSDEPAGQCCNWKKETKAAWTANLDLAARITEMGKSDSGYNPLFRQTRYDGYALQQQLFVGGGVRFQLVQFSPEQPAGRILLTDRQSPIITVIFNGLLRFRQFYCSDICPVLIDADMKCLEIAYSYHFRTPFWQHPALPATWTN